MLLSHNVRACERVSKSVLLFSSSLTSDRVSCRYDKYGSKEKGLIVLHPMSILCLLSSRQLSVFQCVKVIRFF